MAVGDAAIAAADTTASVQVIPLPVNQTFNGAGPVFKLTQTGTGATGQFFVDNPANTVAAVLGQSNGSGTSVRGLMTGSGRAGVFEIANSTSTSAAVVGQSNGSGNSVRGLMTGTGRAGLFEVANAANGSAALDVSTIGTGFGVHALNSGTGVAGSFEIANSANFKAAVSAQTSGSGPAGVFESSFSGSVSSNPVLDVKVLGRNHDAQGINVAHFGANGSAGAFSTLIASNSAATLGAITIGTGPAGYFRSDNPAGFGALRAISDGMGTGVSAESIFGTALRALALSGNAIEARTGAGWAGVFTGLGAGSGVQITTQGAPGLQVAGGTKNAVVPTSGGARALYTEESSEVWFTDYGFARLTNARVHIAIDPTFGETVNLETPYHVFVQTYGDADLVVRNRTAEGFDVEKRGGKERDAEFSYRVVAKRLGFETERLKRAPWADSTTAELAIRTQSRRVMASAQSSTK